MHQPRRRTKVALIAAAALSALPANIVRAEDGSAPALLQWFDGSYKTIERRMPDYFMAGYGGLWTPPPTRADSGNGSVGYDVYDRFDLGSAGNPTQYGTETGLKAMIAQTHNAGGRVYLDLVWNHNGFSQWNKKNSDGSVSPNTSFLNSGGYPGFYMGTYRGIGSSGTFGDFHDPAAGGDENMQLSGLIDIDQSSNNQFIRNPVNSGDPHNLPPGTSFDFGRQANVAKPSNARFYQDQSSYITVTDARVGPRDGNNNPVPFKIYNFTNNPAGGIPVQENATGYLMRNARWMIQDTGADGFRLDATKNYPDWVLNYFDQAVYGAITKPLLDGSRQDVWSFGEAFDTSTSVLQPRIRHDISSANAVGGNRDTLDFPLYYAMQNNLTGNGQQNDWRNVVNSSIDGNDDGYANNGSQGVAFVQSHDGSGSPPYLSNVAYAYTLMRPGNAIVYFNGNEFGTRGNNFPQQGRGDALGGQFGSTITKLVDIRDRYGNGNYIPRSVTSATTTDKEDLVYERNRSMIVALSNRLDNGYDDVTITTSFAPGTPLVELTGNAADATIDPTNHIPEVIVVNADRTANLSIPRNKNTSGTEHDKGYVIYGPSGPQGTFSLSGIARTIAPETQSSANNGTARITAIDVVQGNSLTATLNTNKVNLLGSIRDHNADGDNALLKLDGGLDLNNNGHVDYVTPNAPAYGFEEFTTTHVPGFTSADNNGTYAQTIDTSGLSEGYHYIEARAFRHRDPATEGADPPPIYSSFKKVIYVDHVRAPSAIASFDAATAGVNETRDLIVKSLDGTASDLTKSGGSIVKGVHTFFDYGASQKTTDQLVADAYNNNTNAAGDYDRDLSTYRLFNVSSGNHVATVVMFEPSYDPALGYAGGGVSVTRFPALYVSSAIGQGLGDTDFNGTLSSGDANTFYAVVRGNNVSFNAAADLNGDGLVNDADSLLYLPWLTYKSADANTIATATGWRLTRALETDGTLNVVGGTLDVSGTSVPGVPITFNGAFNITAGHTVTKTGSQTLTINGTQTHGANAVLAVAQGTANINTNGGTNLTVSASGAGSQVNFGTTQTLKAVAVDNNAVASVVAGAANNAWGGKTLSTQSLSITGGARLDANNNNLVLDYTGSSTLPAVQSLLFAGRNGGAWNGAGGIVSTSAGLSGGLRALGAAEASDALGLAGTQTATWSGVSVDSSGVLVKYTYAGDANLDGKIDVSDYGRIDFNTPLHTSGWFNGDFNYDGKIDISDYGIIDFNVAIQGAPIISSAAIPAVGAAVAVPEPTSVALLSLASFALLYRRRRLRRRHHQGS